MSPSVSGGSEPASKKRRKTGDETKFSSPSVNASSAPGFRQTNQAMRSLLMHPVGIGLASLLNEKEISSTTLLIDKELLVYNESTERDGVFKAAMAEWNGEAEKDLTKKILKRIKNTKIEGFKTSETNESNSENDNVLLIEAENGINVGQGRLDFVISNEIGKNEKSIVMMIEFGIGHHCWWKKQDQILRYVGLLLKQQKNKKHVFAFDQPILLTVVTVNKPNSRTEGGSGVDTVDVRYGMFLCTRRNDGDFRLALLWRKHSTDLEDASKQFGKILHAASVCAMLRENVALHNSYQYLGPNCCKFDKLVRSCHVYVCGNTPPVSTTRKLSLTDSFLIVSTDEGLPML